MLIRALRASGVRCMSSPSAEGSVKVPIELIKELRRDTGATVMHIRQALMSAENNPERARELLRDKFQAQFVKHQSKDATEGLVMTQIGSSFQRASLVKLSCQTDFVARTEKFIATVRSASDQALEKEQTVEELNEACHDKIVDAVGSLGEPIKISSAVSFDVDPAKTVVSQYVHNTIEPDVGKIGVLIALDSPAADDPARRERVEELAKQLAMQVAAMSPLYLSVDEIPPAELKDHIAARTQELIKDKKDAVLAEAEALAGARSWADEKALLEQTFILEQSGKLKVKDAIEALERELDSEIVVHRFHRSQV